MVRNAHARARAYGAACAPKTPKKTKPSKKRFQNLVLFVDESALAWHVHVVTLGAIPDASCGADMVNVPAVRSDTTWLGM